MKIFRLTYDEKNLVKNTVKYQRHNDETGKDEIVTKTVICLPCMFKGWRLTQELAEFGFTTFPEGMRNILENYGFRYDPVTGDWVHRINATATHIAVLNEDGTITQDDEYSEECGLNIAIAKAKKRAQEKSYKIMCEFYGIFAVLAEMFGVTVEHFDGNLQAETEALERAIETGYCGKRN
jgi:hypothetical protein